MKRTSIYPAGIVLALLVGGCLSLSVGNSGAYVLRGKATAIENNGSAFIWQADNGQIYLLFQDPNLSNQDFDTVTTPGIRSRLELLPRKDLGVAFLPGAITADVVKVLEIMPPS